MVLWRRYLCPHILALILYTLIHCSFSRLKRKKETCLLSLPTGARAPRQLSFGQPPGLQECGANESMCHPQGWKQVPWQGWECSLSRPPVIKRKAGSLLTLYLIMTEGNGLYQSGMFWVSYSAWLASVSSVQWEDGSILFPKVSVRYPLQLEADFIRISQLALFFPRNPQPSRPPMQYKCTWTVIASPLDMDETPEKVMFPHLFPFGCSTSVFTFSLCWKTLFCWLVSRWINGTRNAAHYCIAHEPESGDWSLYHCTPEVRLMSIHVSGGAFFFLTFILGWRDSSTVRRVG